MYRLLLVFSGVCVGWREGEEKRRERERKRERQRERAALRVLQHKQKNKTQIFTISIHFQCGTIQINKRMGEKKCFSAVRKETKYFHCQTFF